MRQLTPAEWQELCADYFRDFRQRFPDLMLRHGRATWHLACASGYGPPVTFCAYVDRTDPGPQRRVVGVAFGIPEDWTKSIDGPYIRRRFGEAGIPDDSFLLPREQGPTNKPEQHEIYLETGVEWPGDITDRSSWTDIQDKQKDLLVKMEPIVAEIYKQGKQGGKKPPHFWGNWTYNGDTFVLTFRKNHWEYEVDLDECRDSAEVLDSIIQVSNKNVMTSGDVGTLVQAINAVLDPQGHMCSNGQNRRIEPRKVAASRGYDVAP
jgi:hypothetical protein